MKTSRREFLRQVALAAGALAMPSGGLGAAHPGAVEPSSARRKILIIGAGLAGLAAAYELKQAGHQVTILEARQRPGGRVLTLRDPFADGLYAEAGATRIGDNHHFTLRYAEHFGLALDPFQPLDLPSTYHLRGQRIHAMPDDTVSWPVELTPEERRLGIGGMVRKYVAPLLAEAGDFAAPDWPPRSLRAYDERTLSQVLEEQGMSANAVDLMITCLGGWDDRADTYSALWILRYLAFDGQTKQYLKIRGGNDHLPRAFAAELADEIRYGAPVVRIEHDRSGVRVVYSQSGSHQKLTGDYLVCAVPFPVQKDIEVSPPFSLDKQTAIEQLPYMSLSKIFLQSRRRFWVRQGLSGFAFTDLPVQVVWDLTHRQPGNRGILLAYPRSFESRRFTAMESGERVELALENIEQIYPGMRRNFEGGVSKCWDEDEWARGAVALFKPGQMTTLLPHVARPEGRIHFAGEHTSPWGGWMQGALESGNRVAHEIHEVANGLEDSR